MTPILKIFITENCTSCEEARRIATRLEQDYPTLAIELIDVADPHACVPETVFATPTFMLNSRIVSLGNPSPEQIDQWVAEAEPPFAE